MATKKRAPQKGQKRPAKKKPSTDWLDFRNIPQKMWLFMGLVLVATFYFYRGSLDNGFVNWDDEVYVLENPDIGSTEGWFKRVVSLNYHPITMISLAMNYEKPAEGEQPDAAPFHRTNLIFHLLNTLLVFLFVMLLTRNKAMIAITAAVLFGLHPMHVESVAWISERKDVLYVFFFLLGLISWYHYRYGKQKNLFYLLSIVFFVLSCLSKAMAVVFPIVLLLIDYFDGRILRTKFSVDEKVQKMPLIPMKAITEKLPHLAIALLFGLIAVDVQGGGNFHGFFNIEVQDKAIAKFDAFSIWQRVMFASYGFVMYIVKLIWPVGLVTFYPYPTLKEINNFEYTAMPFIALAIVGFAIYMFRKNKWITFGFMFYLITVALVLQFLSVGKVIMADRYTYLPYVGLGILLGYGLYRLAEKNRSMATPIAVIIAALGIFWGSKTSMAVEVWKDGETLWTQVLKHYPRTYEAYTNRGNLRGKEGRIQGALDDFKIAIQIKDSDPEILKSLGNAYGSLNQYEESVKAFNKAIKLKPNDYTYYLNRGVTHGRVGNDSLALSDFENALRLSPSWEKVGILNYIVTAAFQSRQNQKGIDALIRLTELQPNNVNLYQRLYQVYSQLGDAENAARMEQKLREMGATPTPQ